MGKTRRRPPSSWAYMRRQRHRNYRRQEEMAADEIEDVPARHRNRIASRNTQIPDPWDDQTVSHYRGQDWHRN